MGWGGGDDDTFIHGQIKGSAANQQDLGPLQYLPMRVDEIEAVHLQHQAC